MASTHHSSSPPGYYVPEQSKWPIIGSIGLFLTAVGLGIIMARSSAGQDTTAGWWTFLIGSLVMAYMLFGWISNVIHESMSGLYNNQMDRSFRWGMTWFIFSEIMFFGAFFFALFYARFFSITALDGTGDRGASAILWPDFEAAWPLLKNPDNTLFPGPTGVIDPWHIPLINTILLLASSVTLTVAHHALKQGKRSAVTIWTAATILLGLIFIGFQIYEYVEAYTELNLTLKSGIYGSTFFMLTGFHGAHVTLGTIMLIIMLIRVMKGHFTPEHHFAFEASSWYWHFVDVVWLGLFVFVYIL